MKSNCIIKFLFSLFDLMKTGLAEADGSFFNSGALVLEVLVTSAALFTVKVGARLTVETHIFKVELGAATGLTLALNCVEGSVD